MPLRGAVCLQVVFLFLFSVGISQFGIVHSFLLVQGGVFSTIPTSGPSRKKGRGHAYLRNLRFYLTALGHATPTYAYISRHLCFLPPILLSGFSMGTIADVDLTRIEHSAYT